MAQTTEERFRHALIEKYGETKKYLLPKEEYYRIIEELKATVEGPKSRRQYYLLSNKYP